MHIFPVSLKRSLVKFVSVPEEFFFNKYIDLFSLFTVLKNILSNLYRILLYPYACNASAKLYTLVGHSSKSL